MLLSCGETAHQPAPNFFVSSVVQYHFYRKTNFSYFFLRHIEIVYDIKDLLKSTKLSFFVFFSAFKSYLLYVFSLAFDGLGSDELRGVLVHMSINLPSKIIILFYAKNTVLNYWIKVIFVGVQLC